MCILRQQPFHEGCAPAGASRLETGRLICTTVTVQCTTHLCLGSCLQLGCLWRVTGILIENESLPVPPKAQTQLGAYAPARTAAAGFGKRHLKTDDPFWPLPTSFVRADVSKKDHNLWHAGPVEVREAQCVMKHSEQCELAN